MGIFKALRGSIGSTLADQWLDYFLPSYMTSDVLMQRAVRQVTPNSANRKSDPNIITNGSIFVVSEDQCAITVDRGRVTGVFSEPGEHTFQSDASQSMLHGGGAKAALSEMGRRFAFGGDAAPITQRIYYINTREIIGNWFKTRAPIPIRIHDPNTGLDMDGSFTCSGSFSYRIVDPEIFYRKVAGNVMHQYLRSQLDSTLQSKMLTIAQIAAAKLVESGIRPFEMSEIEPAFSEIVRECMSTLLLERRGIEVVSLGLSSFLVERSDIVSVQTLQKDKVLTDPTMAAAQVRWSIAESMKAAAKAPNPLSLMGTAGAAGFSGSNSQGEWICSCGRANTGKFCENCGTPRP